MHWAKNKNMSLNKQQNAIIINNLTVAYQNQPVLWDISVTIPSGKLLAIVGPNGAGKTTFIKSILGLIKPIAGSVHILGGLRAQKKNNIAYVPQRSTVDWDFPINALDVVLMGRYGHIGWIFRPCKKDIERALYALDQVGMSAYSHHPIGKLSGGQQQRVFLARALVQNAHIYLMDEPFVGVDIATERTVVSLLKKLRDRGKTVVVVHHDLQTLTEYFDAVLLLNVRRIAYGPVQQVLMPEYICAAYGNRNLMKHRNQQ